MSKPSPSRGVWLLCAVTLFLLPTLNTHGSGTERERERAKLRATTSGPFRTSASGLLWKAQDGDRCQSLLLTTEGEATVGRCNGPRIRLHLSEGQFAYANLWFGWLERFAAFTAKTPSGAIAFQGRGQEVASPAWQRALAAWAELVHSELESGRSGASWGTALSWRGEVAGRAGYCHYLQVELYGRAQASLGRCEGGDMRDLGQAWLETSEWERFDTWLYSRASAFREGLSFFGMGSQQMSRDEMAELEGWTRDVYARMATAERKKNDRRSEPNQRAEVAGTYKLVKARGQTLPAVVSEDPSTGHKQEVTGGTVVLGEDQTFP